MRDFITSRDITEEVVIAGRPQEKYKSPNQCTPSELAEMEDLNTNYPVFGAKSDSKIRNVELIKKRIEAALKSFTKYPVKAWAYNFRSIRMKPNTPAHKYCDILILEYIEEEGSVPVGEIKTKIRPDNIAYADGTPYRNPFSKKTGEKIRADKYNQKISATMINLKCVEKKFDYRHYKMLKTGNTNKIVFWHPDFGFSKNSVQIARWLKTFFDPFKMERKDSEDINDIKLLIYDNNLSDLYEVSGKRVSRDINNLRMLDVFCKIHGKTNKARISDIKKTLTFNCPLCRSKDFGGVRKLKQLHIDPKLDWGLSVIYLVILSISGIKTLKFGITTRGSLPEINAKWIERRFQEKNVKVISILREHRAETELLARTMEQKMLISTIGFINEKIPQKFGGYTECRTLDTNIQKLCTRVFDDVIIEA